MNAHAEKGIVPERNNNSRVIGMLLQFQMRESLLVESDTVVVDNSPDEIQQISVNGRGKARDDSLSLVAEVAVPATDSDEIRCLSARLLIQHNLHRYSRLHKTNLE